MTNQHQNKPLNKNQRAFNPRPLNNAMADQLRNFKVQSNKGYQGQKKLIDLEGDGIDHANIYQNPKTKIGKILSPFSERPFTIPLHGRFNSRLGLYFYLLSSDGDDNYRTMNSNNMLRYSYRANNRQPFYPNLSFFMAQALCAQIKNDTQATKIIYNNELPFEAYFFKYFSVDGVDNFVPTRPREASWFVDIANNICKAIQSGEEIDLNVFIDSPEELEKLQNKILSNPYPVIDSPVSTAPKKKKKKKQPKNKNGDNSPAKSYFETNSELTAKPIIYFTTNNSVFGGNKTLTVQRKNLLNETTGLIFTEEQKEEILLALSSETPYINNDPKSIIKSIVAEYDQDLLNDLPNDVKNESLKAFENLKDLYSDSYELFGDVFQLNEHFLCSEFFDDKTMTVVVLKEPMFLCDLEKFISHENDIESSLMIKSIEGAISDDFGLITGYRNDNTFGFDIVYFDSEISIPQYWKNVEENILSETFDIKVNLDPEEETNDFINCFYDGVSQKFLYLNSWPGNDVIHHFVNSDKISTELNIDKVIAYSKDELKNSSSVIRLNEPMTIEEFRIFISSSEEIETPEVQSQETEALPEPSNAEPSTEPVKQLEDKVLTDIPQSVYVPKYPLSI